MMKARAVVVAIKKRGGTLVRQVGGHARYEAPYIRRDGSQGRVQTSVAMHPGDIPLGTLRAIEKDMEPAFGKEWLR